MMSEQRRQYSRIHFSSGARLLVADRELACAVLDLSLRGALLAFDGDPPDVALDERCLLEITLGDTCTVIRMEGHVAHAEGHHLGLTCCEIDLDSITHLRRLLALNLGDAEMLNREFSVLVAGATT
tara:strand:+ start:5238 stop:5615 length:378 start_codon:yes stop_codon:yes gene_type:complete